MNIYAVFLDLYHAFLGLYHVFCYLKIQELCCYCWSSDEKFDIWQYAPTIKIVNLG